MFNFEIPDIEGRITHVQELINTNKSPDLEMAANYILWGKDPATGLNSVQLGHVLEPSKKTDWKKTEAFESLDELLVKPGFNEAVLSPLTVSPTKLQRRVFDRDLARHNAPPDLQPILEKLWTSIDELDYQISTWEYNTGKRKSEPRPELIARIPSETRALLDSKCANWTPTQCLRARRKLVELRREQYTYKDTYSTLITRKALDWYTNPDTPLQCGTDINVKPLGLYDPLVFKDILSPFDYTENDLKRITHLLWDTNPDALYEFDFTNTAHIYALLQLFDDFSEPIENFESTAQQLLLTLEYYAAQAEINEAYREVFDLKLKGFPNKKIAQYINKKYNKSYSENYISTIFCQKIVPKIAEAALLHRELVENLPFEENWKRCNGCGVLKLVDARFFMRRKTSKDGYSTICKCCERNKRKRRKTNE